MKASAKRRRGRDKIREDKEREARQRREVEEFLSQRAQLKADNENLQQRLQQQVDLEGEVQQLIDKGLMRLDADGTAHHDGSWEEHQQLAATIQQEQQIAQQLIQQQQNQLQFGVDQERQRAGGQLELHEDMNSNASFQRMQQLSKQSENASSGFVDAEGEF